MKGLLPLYRYAVFDGRSDRAEFWQFVGLATLAVFIALVLDTAMGNGATPLLTILLGCSLLVPWYAVWTRRLHDRNVSGKWLIPLVISSVASFLLPMLAGRHAYTASGDFLVSLDRINDWIGRGLTFGLLGLTVLRGDPDANAYGSPPDVGASPSPTPRDLVDRARNAAASLNTPAARLTATTAVDPLDQIERLAKLREAGSLTDDEFQTQKAAYLSKLQS